MQLKAINLQSSLLSPLFPRSTGTFNCMSDLKLLMYRAAARLRRSGRRMASSGEAHFRHPAVAPRAEGAPREEPQHQAQVGMLS